MPVKWFLLACSLLIASLTLAQKPQATGASEKATSDPIPKLKLTFVEEEDAPRVPASLMIYGPAECANDGAVFLHTASRSDPRKNALLSIGIDNDNYSATSFSLEAISDLHDAQLKTYFATESAVTVLVNATRDDALSTSKQVVVVPSTGERHEREIKSGVRHDYLSTFDRQGNYKSSVELDLPFTPRRIAVFTSGLFLVIGFDAEKKTRFAFVNADGTLQRFLDTEKPLAGEEKMTEAAGLSKVLPPELAASPHSNLGLAQIVSFRDKLLFVMTGMTWILEISPGGAVRRINIHVPSGLVIDHFLPSQKTWYVSLRKYGADSNQDQETTFYEFSPDNGMIARRFDTTPQYVSEIACEHDGEFWALVYDVKGLILFRGRP